MSKPEIPRLIYGAIASAASDDSYGHRTGGEIQVVRELCNSLTGHALNQLAAPCVTCPFKAMIVEKNMDHMTGRGMTSVKVVCGARENGVSQCPDGYNHGHKGWLVNHPTGDPWLMPGEALTGPSSVTVEVVTDPPEGAGHGHKSLREINIERRERRHDLAANPAAFSAMSMDEALGLGKDPMPDARAHFEEWLAGGFKSDGRGGVLGQKPAGGRPARGFSGPLDPTAFSGRVPSHMTLNKEDLEKESFTRRAAGGPVENPDVPTTFFGETW